MTADTTLTSSSSPQELLQIKDRVTQSFQEAETILTSIPDGIILLSNLGSILIFNRQAKHILNIPEDIELLHQPFSDIFPDAFFGFSLNELLSSSPCPKTIRLTLIINDVERDVEVFVKKNTHNNHIFILIRDRSEYKQLEHAIEKYKNVAELGKITATLAHEIRNPLSGIIGFANLLKEEIPTPRHRKMLTSIIEGSRSLEQFISSMLEYTKHRPLHLKSVNLQEFFSSLIPPLSLAFPSCRFVRKTIAPYIRSIDPDRIRLAIWNLVKNAAEATSKPITLTLLPTGSFSVSNPGDLSPHTICQLFTPFFTTKPSGHGLGLSEVQTTMRLHGGEVTVTNNNHTITFALTFPPEPIPANFKTLSLSQ